MPIPYLPTLLVPLLLLAASESALGQGEDRRGDDGRGQERRGFIGLGIGPSVPIGAFAKRSPSDAASGNARPGYTSTLVNLGYRFRDRFGVAGVLAYSEFYIRDAEEDDWWQVAEIAVGPMYTHPLGARAALDLKAMVGMTAMTPVIDSYTSDDGTGSGLGVDLRATLRYDVARRWALFADGGLQAAGVSYNSGARTSYRAVISGLGVAFRPVW